MCVSNVCCAFVCVCWLIWIPLNSFLHKDCTLQLKGRKPPMNTQNISVFVIRPHKRASEDPQSFALWIPFCFAFSLAETSTWAVPSLNRKQPLVKRAAISQPVKTGHILFCVGLTLSSPKLCSPLVTSQAWWNLYWCCPKGLELIQCFFLTAQFWIGPRCHRTGCPAEAELSWAVDIIHTVAIIVPLLKCCVLFICFHPELSSQS